MTTKPQSKPLDNVVLILSDARGQCIPRDFVYNDYTNELNDEHCRKWHIKQEDAVELADPDGEYYREVWDSVLQYAYFVADDGREFRLHQDGDLWGLCYEQMTNEERRNFGFEVDDEDENEE